MRHLFLLILLVLLFSCNRTKREFFQSMGAENRFLDSFSLYNLKSFGMSSKPISKNGKLYYEFNCTSNLVYVRGYFRKENRKLFFLPKNSEKEFLFLDASLGNSSAQLREWEETTKDNDLYELRWLGFAYNYIIKDSTFKIQINEDGIFTLPESLVFEVSKNFDILKIEHVNCKNDTLIMNFYPKQEVYFSHINKAAVCL